MRVAITKLSTVSDFLENQHNCIRLINEAASLQANVIVLPQYANTDFYNLELWGNYIESSQYTYNDHNQAWQNAVDIDGDFLTEVANLALIHQCFIVINVTLRQDKDRAHNDPTIKSNISVTSCLFSPSGDLVQQYHKQCLSHYEREFFTAMDSSPSNAEQSVALFDNAALGLLMADDTCGYLTAQSAVEKGATLLCNSVDIGSQDQTNYHDLTRANDNGVFIASSLKKSPVEALNNPSQIIAPNGRVVASLEHDGVSCIEIETTQAHNKEFLVEPTVVKSSINNTSALIQQKPIDHSVAHAMNTAKTINVAIYATYKSFEEAIDDVCHYIENNLSDIIQLPELFFLTDKSTSYCEEHKDKIESLSKTSIDKISNALKPMQYVCASLIVNGKHCAVLINNDGVVATQNQRYANQRYPWSATSNNLHIFTVPLEQGIIRFTMLTGNDYRCAEIMSVASANRAQLLLIPFDIQTETDANFRLISRAIENNVCLVAASREKVFRLTPDKKQLAASQTNPTSNKKDKQLKSTGLIINLPVNTQQLTYWKARKLAGYLNEPMIKTQFGKITKAVIHPFCSDNA